jgi:hypothetical protein
MPQKQNPSELRAARASKKNGCPFMEKIQLKKVKK